METQKKKQPGIYEKHIIKIVHCSENEAIVVEEIMRNHIFHSTLDWQTVEEFETGAREAYELMVEMCASNTLPESYQSFLKFHHATPS